MRIHRLKIKPEYYQDILLHGKSFELRKNDRDFLPGDTIKFTDLDGNDYDNRHFLITYVLKDVPEYGLMPNYAILSIIFYEVQL